METITRLWWWRPHYYEGLARLHHWFRNLASFALRTSFRINWTLNNSSYLSSACHPSSHLFFLLPSFTMNPQPSFLKQLPILIGMLVTVRSLLDQVIDMLKTAHIAARGSRSSLCLNDTTHARHSRPASTPKYSNQQDSPCKIHRSRSDKHVNFKTNRHQSFFHARRC